jgi:lipopolysaccharide transport system permease protein
VSPVAYPSSLVPDSWRWVYGLNPMAGVIDGFRWALAGAPPPDAALLAASTLGVAALLASGIVCLQKFDQTVADGV